MDFEVGQVAGDYEILALLGAGGMGKVYKVRNIISERIDAMKVLLARLDEHPELVDRFSREIKVTATLDHPNIAALRTAQRIGNQLAMVMEYVEGSTLDSLMRVGAMPLAQVLEIVNQALSALAYAHSRGVVHRDIKPANIMVTLEGHVKLMDFGIARMAADRSLTKTGQMVGSLYYMSPEQVESKSPDARSDLYSLGVTLYEMVTGKKPFEGDSDYAILAGHLHQPPRPPIELSPGVPEGLNEIILMALAKDPNQRFQTAVAFRGALNDVAIELGIPLSAWAEGASSSRGRASGSNLLGAASSSGAASAAAIPPIPPPMADTVALPQQTPLPPPMAEANQSGRSGKRALWMVAGALATLLILAGAVIYLPKLRQAKANPATQPQTTLATTPVQAPSQVQPSQEQPVAPTPSPATDAAVSIPAPRTSPRVSAQPARAKSTKDPTARTATEISAPQVSDEKANVPPPADVASPPRSQPPNNAEVEKVQDEMDLLGARAAAVRRSLDNLQRQQAAQGYGLRGDIAASRERMELFLERAQNRLQHGNVTAARKSLENAGREVTKLEKFLGR